MSCARSTHATRARPSLSLSCVHLYARVVPPRSETQRQPLGEEVCRLSCRLLVLTATVHAYDHARGAAAPSQILAARPRLQDDLLTRIRIVVLWERQVAVAMWPRWSDSDQRRDRPMIGSRSFCTHDVSISRTIEAAFASLIQRQSPPQKEHFCSAKVSPDLNNRARKDVVTLAGV